MWGCWSLDSYIPNQPDWLQVHTRRGRLLPPLVGWQTHLGSQQDPAE